MARRLDLITGRAEAEPSIEDRLAGIETQLRGVAQRNEEILAYLAARANRAADAATAYLGDNTAVTFLETGQRIARCPRLSRSRTASHRPPCACPMYFTMNVAVIVSRAGDSSTLVYLGPWSKTSSGFSGVHRGE